MKMVKKKSEVRNFKIRSSHQDFGKQFDSPSFTPNIANMDGIIDRKSCDKKTENKDDEDDPTGIIL